MSERTLWSIIRKERLGFSFRRQYPIGKWVLDFYCPEAKLCIEVDGDQHESTRDRDAYGDSELQGIGIATIRIPSLDLFTESGAELSFWMKQIVQLCEDRTGRTVWPNGIHL